MVFAQILGKIYLSPSGKWVWAQNTTAYDSTDYKVKKYGHTKVHIMQLFLFISTVVYIRRKSTTNKKDPIKNVYTL